MLNYFFENMISQLNVELFSVIATQTTPDDQRVLLAVQSIVRNAKKTYVYLEIGSYLGGSIQTHLRDYKCARIYSIDKRPFSQPDDRFSCGCQYPDNSTQKMLDKLCVIPGDINKIVCFDDDASGVDKGKIKLKPDICFIDGEHTNKKIISDYYFCKSVMNRDGIIIFHDEGRIRRGLDQIVGELKRKREVFKCMRFKTSMFIIFFGESVHQLFLMKSMEVKRKIRWRYPFS